MTFENDGYPTRELLKGLGTLANFVRDYEDSHSKATVFNVIMGIVTEIHDFRRKVCDMEFFAPPLILMPLRAGMIAYTMKDKQINLHFAVPVALHMGWPMMQQMADKMDTLMFEAFTVNMRPLRISTPDLQGDCIRYRRTIPATADPLTLESERLVKYEDKTVEVQRVFLEPREVSNFVPLTKANEDYPEDTIFWARTSCQKLVAFRNPFLPVMKATCHPDCITDIRTVYTCFPATLHPFVDSIYPSTLEATILALRDENIPGYVKPTLVLCCKALFGIRDELILQVGVLMQKQQILPTPLHNDMLKMTRLVKMGYMKNSNDSIIAQGVVDVLKNCKDQRLWDKWVLDSQFVYFLFDCAEMETIRRMCEGMSIFRFALAKLLRIRSGNWGRKEREQAVFLRKLCASQENAVDDEKIVFDELLRVNELADAVGGQIIKEEERKAARHERRKSTKCSETPPSEESKGTPSECGPAASLHWKTPATHHSVVAELSKKWPQFQWTLIGSGIFFNSSDADVVVHVDAPSLRDAYVAVENATGFHRMGIVDGQRLCTLHSTWNGIPLDVQVTRHAAETPSEIETWNALSLGKRLQNESSHVMRENVRCMHEWCNAANLKGNRRCKLPGVAVTCMAVTLTVRRNVASITFLLESLRHIVGSQTPCINFDAWDDEVGPLESRRPESPLAVIVNEKNVAQRVTVAWTLHLLDTVAFAATLSSQDVYDSAVYDAWRRQTMVYCATMRPSTEGVLARTLLTTMSKLEGHPLIESYHVDDGLCTGDVVVRCTLLSGGSDKYKFRPHDGIVSHDGYIMVHGRGRTIRLNTSEGPGSPFSASTASGVTCNHWFESEHKGQRFPNAPYLSIDVIAAFNPMLWEAV